jgi:hypothetical protein
MGRNDKAGVRFNIASGEGVWVTLGSISLQSVAVASSDQISSDLMGEAVILDLKHGVYHGLDAVGARIWTLLQDRRPLHEIRDAILQEYDVEPDRCERDLIELVRQLAEKGLVEISDG